MRVFLDTNVLVSAYATRGICADLLRYVLAERELIVGEDVLTEFRRVLRDRMRLPVAMIDEIEVALREHEIVPKPKRQSVIEFRDPADAWILASAVEGNADVLVTGDEDLLELGKRSPIPIQTPRSFWERASGFAR